MAKPGAKQISGDRPATSPDRRGRLVAPSVMVLVLILFNLKPILLGKSYVDPSAFHHDLWACFPGLLAMARDCWATGHFPLWDPYMHMGTPYLAFFIPSALHPLAAPFLFFDFQRSLALLTLSNLLLLSSFAYLFFRRAGARPWGAAGAGALLCMTGFIPWVSPIINVNLALPWFLCWMWSAMGIAEKPEFKKLVWNLIAVLVLLLGGDPQILVEGIYMVTAWFLVWAWFRRLGWRQLASTSVALGAAAAIGLTAALVQVLPTGLMVTRLVSTSQISLGEFAGTFPTPPEVIAGTAGLFSRLFSNLFLTFAAPLLIWYAWRRRKSAPLKASLLIAIMVATIVVGARLGLAAIPYCLPLLKGYFRHYKYAVILQGPLFLGVALGFDELIAAFGSGASRGLRLIFITALAATALVIRDPVWIIPVGAAGALFLYLARNPSRGVLLPPVLFLLLILDAGSYLWKTPYSLAMPSPDPIYLEYIKKISPGGRVHAMYPWVARMGRQADQPLPPQGTGYHGDYTFDPWFEYPLNHHAWFLSALSGQAASIKNGVVQRSDFVLAFKSSDFVNPGNQKLINLAAIRFFFLQDFALSQADRYPILSDPAYLANPARPRAFAPWRRSGAESPTGASGARPALAASGHGVFSYQKDFRPGDIFKAVLQWGDRPSRPGLGSEPPDLAAVVYRSAGGSRLIQARFFGPETRDRPGAIRVDFTPAVSGPEEGEVRFILVPTGPASPHSLVPNGLRWMDPLLINPDGPLRYRGGDRVMVFENEEALGRARVVHQALSAPDNETARALMMADEYDPARMTVVSDPSAPPAAESGDLPGETARIKLDQNDIITVETRLSSSGYLVLADTYYPGWRAFDGEGQELRIYRADLNLRAVLLNAGTNTVVFKYLPSHFRIGLLASLASLAALAGLVLVRLPSIFKPKSGRE